MALYSAVCSCLHPVSTAWVLSGWNHYELIRLTCTANILREPSLKVLSSLLEQHYATVAELLFISGSGLLDTLGHDHANPGVACRKEIGVKGARAVSPGQWWGGNDRSL